MTELERNLEIYVTCTNKIVKMLFKDLDSRDCRGTTSEKEVTQVPV